MNAEGAYGGAPSEVDEHTSTSTVAGSICNLYVDFETTLVRHSFTFIRSYSAQAMESSLCSSV